MLLISLPMERLLRKGRKRGVLGVLVMEASQGEKKKKKFYYCSYSFDFSCALVRGGRSRKQFRLL